MSETTESLIERLELERQVQRKDLLNRGLSFSVPKLSLLRYLPGGFIDEKGRKARKLTLYKPYIYTMDVLSELKLQVKINMLELTGGENPIRYKNQVIKDNNKLMCRIIAVALLNRKWKINLFAGMLSNYLISRINSEDLNFICNLIEEMEDAGNFINSTVLMAGADRTTRPKPIQTETQTQAVKQ